LSAAAPNPLTLLGEHWSLAPSVSAGAVLALALYGAAVTRLLRARRRWAVGNTCAFVCGVLAVVVALQSGLDSYDDRLLSAHMLQHVLLLLVAPLFLLAGRPLVLALRVLSPARRATLMGLLARLHPLRSAALCLALFSAGVLAVHVPVFFDAAVRHPALHYVEHALLVALGLLLWWPLIGADPVPRHRLGGLGRVFYLIASMPAMALIGAYLNRAPAVVYNVYARPAHALGISAVADQQQAGALMWVGGSTFVIAVGLWLAMSAMVAEERRQSRREQRVPAEPLPLEPIAGQGR
jgi:putative membrane protein